MSFLSIEAPLENISSKLPCYDVKQLLTKVVEDVNNFLWHNAVDYVDLKTFQMNSCLQSQFHILRFHSVFAMNHINDDELFSYDVVKLDVGVTIFFMVKKKLMYFGYIYI